MLAVSEAGSGVPEQALSARQPRRDARSASCAHRRPRRGRRGAIAVASSLRTLPSQPRASQRTRSS